MAFLRGQDRSLPALNKSADIEWGRFPMLSPRTILTDRADGTLWLLSFDTTVTSPDNFGHISLNSVIPSVDRGNEHTYGPYAGPIIGTDPTVRLLVRSGHLGYEQVVTSVRQCRILARRRVEREVREIVIPSSFSASPDKLAWTVVSF